ncbi:MAG: NAD-dependent epimerase/dehydratase family protein [Proteobacteria bacterium]|nr:NAD-dependent epimerase/dehydratase family protein [Pseudomonadota bacterium]NBP13381.1 NAD-dependent epimerase/dehydratase family protein [bacterium]
MKHVVVCGGGGFIGGHLIESLKKQGNWVRGVDLKEPEFRRLSADEFIVGDLRDPQFAKKVLYKNNFRDIGFTASKFLEPVDEVYQLAADMGGAGYIFSGEHDADVMHNSATINLNIAHYCAELGIKKIFYSSSACMYPEHNQLDPNNPNCEESSAYPANPDSEYGWEKLFSERMFLSFNRNYNLDVKIARFHNIFGPYGSYNNGKEKAPAAICRKVAQSVNGGEIEIWGDGEQTRSFLYVDECIEAIHRLMKSDFNGPVNVGSEEMVTINKLVDLVAEIASKKLTKKHIPGPLGVRGRNSDNKLIQEKLGWSPSQPLVDGLAKTYRWIEKMIYA